MGYFMASSEDDSDSSSEYVSAMQSPSVSATPQSPAAPATPATAAPSVSEYFSPMQSPSVSATPQNPAAPATPAPAAVAIGVEIPAAATAVGATIETEMPVVTLLVTVLGIILTVFVTSGHLRRDVRYSAYAVTGLLSLSLVLLGMGGRFGRPELILAGRYLASVVLAAAIVFALFVLSTS